MCNVDPTVQAQLEATVRNFLDSGTPFTAYQVTIETRQREHLRLRHSDVQGAAHDLPVLRDALDYGYDASSGHVQWTRSQVPTGTAGQWAWLYHPVGYDVSSYSLLPSQGTSSPQAKPVSVGSLSSVAKSDDDDDDNASDSGGSNPDGSFSLNYRNRLFVPTRFIRSAGLVAGESVLVLPDPTNRCVLLVKNDGNYDASGYATSTQIVERNGDLRLSAKTLDSADILNGTTKYNIENVGNCVRVTPV